jgi:hypothetical protein
MINFNPSTCYSAVWVMLQITANLVNAKSVKMMMNTIKPSKMVILILTQIVAVPGIKETYLTISALPRMTRFALVFRIYICLGLGLHV